MWLPFATVAVLIASASAQASSPPSYPSPWMRGTDGWEEAYLKAQEFVSGLTLLEKINLTTGVGWEGEACVGNTGSIPRLNWTGLCLQDSPVGIRFTDNSSVFPSGMNAGATWSTRLFKSRGYAMGSEHRDKGIDVQLAPVAGPIGRVTAGGRGWEGFATDPVLTGVAMAHTIQGIQEAGVIACAKHFVANEQEHFRTFSSSYPFDAISANIADATMHELYAWPFADAVRAGVGSVMSSYNQVNNSYAAQNSWLLNHLLKNELGFQGFITSDWWNQVSGVATVLAGGDMTMAGDQGYESGNTYWGSNLTLAVLNGTIPQWRLDDMVVRIMSAYFKVGRDKTRIPVNFNSWTLDTMGYAHPNDESGYTQVNFHVNVQGDHGALIREIGGASTVLLKNDNNALPLRKPKSIAIIGEDAHDSLAGPNACVDRGCNAGTLAVGWGSGVASFPYLIAPVTALKARAAQDSTYVANVSNNYDLTSIAAAATGAEYAIVFANANSGEGFINVDGNQGDRNNLTLWGNGDALVEYVASLNPNTILVLHTVGAVIVEAHKNNPNITSIVWAGLPGQESGNAITDVLYGDVNPQAKTVFTWGKSREDYGVDVMYNATEDPPQSDYTEGVFIDYRHFDKYDIEPTYEFGYGLSYTTYNYTDLKIQKLDVAPYQPTQGKTLAAPTFGTIDYDPENAQFPPGFDPLRLYIYPFINTTVPTDEPQNWPPGAQDGSPQPFLAAGGAAGGNAQLYDELYTVSAKVTNTGSVKGTEIAQLYVNHGGPNDPKVVLRGFDDISLEAGESKTFTYNLTRRDLSNWDTVTQNWVITAYPKTVYVGASSRNLPLSATL